MTDRQLFRQTGSETDRFSLSNPQSSKHWSGALTTWTILMVQNQNHRQPSAFFEITSSRRFDLGKSLSEQVMFSARGDAGLWQGRAWQGRAWQCRAGHISYVLPERTAFGTLTRRSNHQSYLGRPKSTPSILYIDQFGTFWLGDISATDHGCRNATLKVMELSKIEVQ